MIPEVNPYNNYRGDGVATKFDYDFLIQDGSQLIVQKITEDDVAINLVNNVDYEIKEIGNVNGGYINFPLAGSEHSILTENETISLQLTLPFEQESEYGQSSMLNLGSLEFSLDYLTRLCQILKRQMERSVKANEGNDVIDITLPPPKANNTFAWNEDCSALVNYDIIGENNAFKNEMVEEFQSARDEFNTTIATNKQEILDIQEQFEGETNAAIKDFEDGIDAKIATVADAADRINNLDADLAIATNAAAQATQDAQNARVQAEIAANKADEILNVKDELEAEIDTKADIDLSNLSEVGQRKFDDLENLKANKTDVDGQWVYKNVQLFSNREFAGLEAFTVDISDYLPNDGYDYEVFLTCLGITGKAVGDSIHVMCSTGSSAGSNFTAFFGQIRNQVANQSQIVQSSHTLPVSANDKAITISQGNNIKCTINCSIQGYRRLGKNV